MSINKVAWEDISGYAEVICNVRAFGVDLEWARRAWGILQDTPLCEYSNSREFNAIVIRLFCVGEIIHIYNHLSMDECYDPYEAYCEWIDEIGIQKIDLVILAGEEYYSDSYIEEYGEISEVINHLIEMQYDMVVKWLIKGFGGKSNMIDLLEFPTGNEEDSYTYEEAVAAGMNPNHVNISEETVKLYQWKESDFSRNYL